MLLYVHQLGPHCLRVLGATGEGLCKKMLAQRVSFELRTSCANPHLHLGGVLKWGLALMGAFTTFTIDRKNTNKTPWAQLKVSATLLVSRSPPKCKRKKRSGYARLQPYSTRVRCATKLHTVSWEDALIDKLKWYILAYNTCEILYNCIILHYWFTCSRGYQMTFTDSDWE